MAHNALVVLDDRMPLDRALTKLKRDLAMSGTAAELKRRAHYIKPGERRRLKSQRARAKLAKTARRHAAGEAARLQRLGMKE
jgi:small subunit ribosomal protein S21